MARTLQQLNDEFRRRTESPDAPDIYRVGNSARWNSPKVHIISREMTLCQGRPAGKMMPGADTDQVTCGFCRHWLDAGQSA